ncbi:MAG: host attachment protein [Akkermansiaceae bacterium]|jgi:hypothetical protein
MKTNHKETTVVLADMEKLRIIKLSPYETAITPHTKPMIIEEMEFPKKHKHNDSSGRFPQGRSVSETAGMSPGEKHDEESEYKKRRIKIIAQKITDILMREGIGFWFFAAPATINRQIVKLIPPSLQSSMISNINLDLTHLELAEIEKRFLTHNHKNLT